jgi:cell division protein FtsL
VTRPLLGVLALLALVIASAIAVVYTKHLSRVQFAELQRMTREQDALKVEWRRLQLEQSTLATQSRIEQMARERLGMTEPGPDNTRVLVR